MKRGRVNPSHFPSAFRLACAAAGLALIFGARFSYAQSRSSATATNEETLYEFQGGRDGWYPAAAMVADKSGNLYGMTEQGGTIGSCEGQSDVGCGTVFQLKAPSNPGGPWAESLIYVFTGNDGAFPYAPLVAGSDGSLYGSTYGGGLTPGCPTGCGTVFQLAPPTTKGGAWTETVLHYFKGVPSGQGYGDGAAPNYIVFGSNGNLYGTASSGGSCYTNETGEYCGGMAFELERPATPSGAWNEKPLYVFNGAYTGPTGAIFDKFGNLDGVVGGGSNGLGAVFSLAPGTGREWSIQYLYNFKIGNDGAIPDPGLAQDAEGNLYGATFGGGGSLSYGTVFELQAPAEQGGAWIESILYSFGSQDAGENPIIGPVIDSAGNLYGTTLSGGTSDFGLVYKVSPGANGVWNETVLYDFTGGSDGASPVGGLNFGKFGALYGTATAGGTEGVGECKVEGEARTCGVVFGVAPK